MGHFQLFSMILKFSMGHFLSFYTDLWAIFQVNGTMAHGPLPSKSLLYTKNNQVYSLLPSGASVFHKYVLFTSVITSLESMTLYL